MVHLIHQMPRSELMNCLPIFCLFSCNVKFSRRRIIPRLIYRSRGFIWYHRPGQNFLHFCNFLLNFLQKKFHSKKKYTTLIYRSSPFNWCIACLSTIFVNFRVEGGGNPISSSRKLPSWELIHNYHYKARLRPYLDEISFMVLKSYGTWPWLPSNAGAISASTLYNI